MSKMPSLFNVNGSLGCGTIAKSAFRNADDLLKHMDRLGIERSLVWHIPDAGIFDVILESDKEIMKEIMAVPLAKQRLIPAFTVTPLSAYNSKCLDSLMEAMTSGQVKAIRIVLLGGQERLSPLESLVRKVSRFKPVLIFNSKEPLNTDDLLAFSEKFPELPMVYLQGMWINAAAMYDLMQRRQNIYADISWLDMPDNIEKIVDMFGVERLLFGIGLKSSNGASIATLMRARISDNDRELIAHGNLERLLGIGEYKSSDKTGNMKTAGGGNTLWSKLLAGKSLNVDIIDAHGHLGDSEEITDLIKGMDDLGIKSMIASGWEALASEPVKGNFTLAKNTRPFGSRYLGYLTFHPDYCKELEMKFDEFFSDPFFVGFKLLNHYWSVKVTDKRFDAVWKYSDLHRLPILLHTWNDDYDSPSMLKDIVKEYKNAFFILGHSGGLDEGRLEAEELVAENPNVYLEFCGSYLSTILWEDTIKKLGNRQILFGTDSTAHSQTRDLGRFLSIDLPDETLIPMLGANMRKIMAMRK
jgi:uncharacterized protein